MTNRDTLREMTVFVLLAAIGIVGRWIQPDWNFTPLMAVTLLGGYYFRSAIAAASLPIIVLTVSDLILPSHDNVYVQLSIFAMMIVPLMLGRLARGREGWSMVGFGVLCGVVPATTFFLVTNFVHWAATSMYDHTWTGLVNCFTAALPFYRAMLAGDLFYLAVLVSCFALAGQKVPAFARERVKK